MLLDRREDRGRAPLSASQWRLGSSTTMGEPDDGVHGLIASAGDAAGAAEVAAGGGQVAAAEAACRAVVRAAEEQGVQLTELQELMGLSAARSAMQAVSLEDPTATISEIAARLDSSRSAA